MEKKSNAVNYARKIYEDARQKQLDNLAKARIIKAQKDISKSLPNYAKRTQKISRGEEKIKQAEQQEILRRAKSGMRKETVKNIGKGVVKGFRKLDKAQREFGQSTKKLDKVAERGFKKIAGSVKYNKKLSNNLLGYANAFGGSSTGSQGVSRGRGRPQGSLKWRSPFNGMPIPATEYYRQVRAFKRLQTQKAEQVELNRQRQFAQRGVPPNKINQVVDNRLRQQFEIQRQMRIAQQPPRTIPQMQQQAQQINRFARVPSKLRFMNQIQQGNYQGYQPFQQKWW